MLQLIKYLYRNAGRSLLIATVGALVTALAATGLIVIISTAVRTGGQLSSLPWMFYSLCATWLISKSCSEIALLAATQNLVIQLRVSLGRSLLATPIATIEALRKNPLFTMMTQDVELLAGSLQSFSRALGSGVLILTCIAYIASMSWSLALIFTAILLGGCSAYLLLESGFRGGLEKIRHQLDIVYKGVRDLIEGSKQLQLNAERGRNYIEQVIATDAQDYQRVLVSTRTSYQWVTNVCVALFYAVVGGLLFVTPLWWPGGAGISVSVTLILLYLLGPITELMFVLPGLRQGAVALKKIEQLDNVLAPSRERETGPDPFTARSPSLLQLRGVCYQYSRGEEEAPFVLGPIDLSVRHREILFIVGGNGSGKTTLAMLLLGLYRPHRGDIALNGTPVNEQNLEHYRSRFSAVLSDFHLFENLLESYQDQHTSAVNEYLEALEMANKVSVVNGRFSTIDLSNGQRKRLALLSSYIEDRPFYLFDEWAADQDPMFKRVFYKRLLPELKDRGKTVVVITHDESYFSCADRVIKLREGRLDAEGVEPLAAAASKVGSRS